MGTKEDREEFNTSGLRGVLAKAMTDGDEAFIRILGEGWRGEVVTDRPEPGTGPYLHYQTGEEVRRYRNAGPEDSHFTIFRPQL